MHEALWSDDELRTFITTLRGGGLFAPEVDSTERDRFVAQARLRIVPEVQRRVLAEVGAATDASGVAHVAFEVLERETWGKRHTWLMVTTEPWGYVTDLVAREIRSAYTAAVRRRADAKALKGIAAASSRPEIDPGTAE